MYVMDVWGILQSSKTFFYWNNWKAHSQYLGCWQYRTMPNGWWLVTVSLTVTLVGQFLQQHQGQQLSVDATNDRWKKNFTKPESNFVQTVLYRPVQIHKYARTYTRYSLDQCTYYAMWKVVRKFSATWQATEKFLIVLPAPLKRNAVLDNIMKAGKSVNYVDFHSCSLRFRPRHEQYAYVSFQALAMSSSREAF